MDIKEFIKSKETEMKALLGGLVGCQSVQGEYTDGQPFGAEPARALDMMLDAAEKLGFSVKNIDGYCGCADYLPEGAEEIKLGILCHLDVVPAGEGWTLPPYELTEKDGNLYGRGTTDDKGPAVSALYALYAVKELGYKLKSGVRLIFGINEENGSEDIEYYLTKEKMPPMTFTPDANYPVINCEKGMVRVGFSLPLPDGAVKNISGGQVINAVPSRAKAEIDVRFKDILNTAAEKYENITVTESDGLVTISYEGKSAHASTPESGINAITGLLGFLRGIDFGGQNIALSALTELFPVGETDGSSLGIKLCDEVSGGLTEVLSIIDTNDGQLDCRMDIRFPVCSSKAEIHERLTAAFSDKGISITEYTGSEPHYVDGDSELVKALLAVYESFTGEKAECISIGGGTYVHEIDGGVAFGIEHEGKDYKIHGADEYLPISEFIENTEIFAAAIVKICG
ncbi:MAG: Sapep family Mn(2+)-dependent dipeptidase [Eubacterium sp.]|nr:Sapep family Mn(2+)-dependent dipeptidase [Eubacterium sp.]